MQDIRRYQLDRHVGRVAMVAGFDALESRLQADWPAVQAAMEDFSTAVDSELETLAPRLSTLAMHVQAALAPGREAALLELLQEAGVLAAQLAHVNFVADWPAGGAPQRRSLADILRERPPLDETVEARRLLRQPGIEADAMTRRPPAPDDVPDLGAAAQAIRKGPYGTRWFTRDLPSGEALAKRVEALKKLNTDNRGEYEERRKSLEINIRRAERRASALARGMALAAALAERTDPAEWTAAAAAFDARSWPALERPLADGRAALDRVAELQGSEPALIAALQAVTEAGGALVTPPPRLRGLVEAWADRPRLVAALARSGIGQFGLSGWAAHLSRGHLGDFVALDGASAESRALIRALEAPLSDPLESAPAAVLAGDWLQPHPHLAVQPQAIDMIWRERELLHASIAGTECSWPVGEERALAAEAALAEGRGFVTLERGLLLNPARIDALTVDAAAGTLALALGGRLWQEPLAEEDAGRLLAALRADPDMLALAPTQLLRLSSVRALRIEGDSAVLATAQGRWTLDAQSGRYVAQMLEQRAAALTLGALTVPAAALAALWQQDGQVVLLGGGESAAMAMAPEAAEALLERARSLPGCHAAGDAEVLGRAPLVLARWHEGQLLWRSGGEDGAIAMAEPAARRLLAELAAQPGFAGTAQGVVNTAHLPVLWLEPDGSLAAESADGVLAVEPDAEAARGLCAQLTARHGYLAAGNGVLVAPAALPALELRADGLSLPLGGRWRDLAMPAAAAQEALARLLDIERFETASALPPATLAANAGAAIDPASPPPPVGGMQPLSRARQAQRLAQVFAAPQRS